MKKINDNTFNTLLQFSCGKFNTKKLFYIYLRNPKNLKYVNKQELKISTLPSDISPSMRHVVIPFNTAKINYKFNEQDKISMAYSLPSYIRDDVILNGNCLVVKEKDFYSSMYDNNKIDNTLSEDVKRRKKALYDIQSNRLDRMGDKIKKGLDLEHETIFYKKRIKEQRKTIMDNYKKLRGM